MARTFLSMMSGLVLVSLLLGCGKSAVTSPDPVPSGYRDGIQPAAEQNAGQTNRYLWGLYEITINPISCEAKVVPRRLVSGHLNALGFLEDKPCSTCLKVTNVVKVQPKEFLVDIQLRHPFVGLDYYTGFDVRGIVMLDATESFTTSGLHYPDPSNEDGAALLNADGYTALFNPEDYPPGSLPWKAWEYQKGKLATEDYPDANLNPYKCFETSTPRRYFGCATSSTQTYHIRFAKAGSTRLGYAVDANWAPPLQNPPAVPDDFPISANMPEAYHLKFEVIGNTLWIDPSTGSGGGDIRFRLKVYDHQDPHLVSEGGTVELFYWEVNPLMPHWKSLEPVSWEDGVDSIGPYVAYEFIEAPVPKGYAGPHNCVICVMDCEEGIIGPYEYAFLITEINVASGIPCWDPGVLIAEYPSENYDAHLMNGRCTYIDHAGLFHLFYLDAAWAIHHLTYDAGIVTDMIAIPGEQGFNLNAVLDDSGTVHILYSDNPSIKGGDVVYRQMTPDGVIGPATVLSASDHAQQFEDTIAIAPDGDILALWMDSSSLPYRRLCGAYYDGVAWTPEMTLKVCYLPDGWTNHSVVADSSGTFHILYDDDQPLNLYYVWFKDGTLGESAPLVVGDYKSAAPVMSIDPYDRIYVTFQDLRTGKSRGYFIMRDPVSGVWTHEIDMIGHNYETNRFQNRPLPDGRLAVVWTDWRDPSRGLYCKVFDPFLTEEEIQAITDEEIDAAFSAQKNQTRMCMSPDGTLHLVWSDERTGHWQLYYSTCTP